MTQFDNFSDVTALSGEDRFVVHDTSDGQLKNITKADLARGIFYQKNLIRNYPSIEKANGAQPEEWLVYAATLTEEDATGEGVTPAPHERILKIANTVAYGNIAQRFTTSNWPDLYAGCIVSLSTWIYAAAGTTALFLRDITGATNVAVEATVTNSAWTKLSLSGLVWPSDTVEWKVNNSSTGTWYIANPTLHVAPFPLAWAERKLSFKPKRVVLYNGDPGAAGWQTVDLSSYSPRARAALLHFEYANSSTADQIIYCQMGGDTATGRGVQVIRNPQASTGKNVTTYATLLNGDGEFSWQSSAVVGDTETVKITLRGLWEYE